MGPLPISKPRDDHDGPKGLLPGYEHVVLHVCEDRRLEEEAWGETRDSRPASVSPAPHSSHKPRGLSTTHLNDGAALSTTRGQCCQLDTPPPIPTTTPQALATPQKCFWCQKGFLYFTSGHRVVGPESRWTEIEFGTIQGKSRDLKFSLYYFEEQQQKDEFNSVVSCLVASDCNRIDCSSLGSSVPGILQARILQWVAMPSSRGSS